MHYTTLITLHYTTTATTTTLHYTTLHYNYNYTTLQYTRLHYTLPRYSTQHYSTLQYTTLITPHHNYNCNCNYATLITRHYNYNVQLQLHYTTTTTTPTTTTTTTTALHHTTSSSCGDVTTATIAATAKKKQLQPPVGPPVDSLCHPWITTTNLSYRFPIFETSATALCGITGIIWYNKVSLYCAYQEIGLHGRSRGTCRKKLDVTISPMFLAWEKTQSDYPKLDQSTPTVAKSHFRSERTRSTDYI